MEGTPVVPPGTGPLSPEFTGMDPALMARFVAMMEKARTVLDEEIPAILAELSKVDSDRSRMLRCRDVANWVDQEVPNLRRREQLIKAAAALPAWMPGGAQGLRPFDESRFVSAEEARKQGADLARRISATRPGDLGFDLKYTDDEYTAFAKELADRRHDPDFTAAFFAELGVEGSLRLGRRFRDAMHNADKAIDTISEAFGTAVRSGDGLRAFAEIKRQITAGPIMTERGGVWVRMAGLGDLLRAGDFPSDWLAGVVTRHALAPDSNENGEQLAGFLHALGNDPVAARAAIAAATRDTSLEDFLSRLNKRVEVMSSYAYQKDLQAKENSRADAFGRMLAAAAGAYNEKDGAHSPEAAKLAFDLIKTLPRLDIQEPTRIHLAEIAGAYATEFAASADINDPDSLKPSSFGPFDGNLPGAQPAFRLSLTDTYTFVKTFADTDQNMKPFEKAMGELTQRLFAEAVRLDKEAIANPPGGGLQPETATEQVFRRLGNVAGIQIAAQKVIRGTQDIENEARAEAFKNVFGKAVDVAAFGIPLAEWGADGLWQVLVWAGNDTLNAVAKPDKHLPAVNERDQTLTRASLYQVANGLLTHGYTAKDGPVHFIPPTDPLITDGNGRLRPFAEIEKDPARMNAFLEWLKTNGSVADQADRRAFGKQAVSAADRFAAGKARTEAGLAKIDPELGKILKGDD
jgi:hypothetical protein